MDGSGIYLSRFPRCRPRNSYDYHLVYLSEYESREKCFIIIYIPVQFALLEKIFDSRWLSTRKELQYPLGRNQAYRIEVNKWLQFFDGKGWLDEGLVRRLRNANTWPSYYAKINELRAGYFFETQLNFQLTDYEFPTNAGKNVEFKGKTGDENIFIEVKTPLDLDRKTYRGGSFDSSDKIYDLLDRSSTQLPDGSRAIVVLSDDLNVPLFYDLLAWHSLWVAFNSSDYAKISAICILGNITHQEMYKMMWLVNPNAKTLVDPTMFRRFDQLPEMR